MDIDVLNGMRMAAERAQDSPSSPPTRRWLYAGLAATLLACCAGVVQAKDAVRATIKEAGGGIVTGNGSFQSPGTYAVGTIKIDYMVIGTQFPAGTPIKEFELCLDTIEGKSKPVTAYPATVNLEQIGTPDVSLQLTSPGMSFGGPGERACTMVTVAVPAEVANDPDFQADGTELVANLQLSTGPRIHLDTVTTVKVHLTLVHPGETTCLVPLHMVASGDFGSNLGSSGISLQVHMSSGLQSNPQGQHVVALVNTCSEARSVGLNTAINPNFELQSAAAVQTTTHNQQIVDLSALLSALQGSNAFANQGSTMCLPSVSIPAQQTFIVKQHVKMKTDATFPGAQGSMSEWFYDGFTYAALNANTCAAPVPSADVDPAQGEVSVPVNMIKYTGSNALADEYPPH